MTRNMDESRWEDAGPVLRQQWIEAEGPRQEDTAVRLQGGGVVHEMGWADRRDAQTVLWGSRLAID